MPAEKPALSVMQNVMTGGAGFGNGRGSKRFLCAFRAGQRGSQLFWRYGGIVCHSLTHGQILAG